MISRPSKAHFLLDMNNSPFSWYDKWNLNDAADVPSFFRHNKRSNIIFVDVHVSDFNPVTDLNAMYSTVIP